MTENQFLSSDRAILKIEDDKLGRKSFAEAVAKMLLNRRDKDNLVIALYGPYGSGKTSVKNMIVDALSSGSDSSPIIVEFAPWQCTSSEQLTEAFFGEIQVQLEDVAAQLTDQTKAKEYKDASKRLKSYKVLLSTESTTTKAASTILSLFLPAVGPSGEIISKYLEQAAEAAEKGADNAKEQEEVMTRSLSARKKAISEALSVLDRQIIVVLDDLDRLTSDEIALLFQLVKANGDFPNIIYLLLCQREVVESSLKKIAPDAGPDFGREFLEKIVQVPFDIPLIEGKVLRAFLLSELKRVFGEEVDANSPDLADAMDRVIGRRSGYLFQDTRWGDMFQYGIWPYFSNMRKVRLFINTLTLHTALLRPNQDLLANPVDLIGLETLRLFEPKIYQRMLFLKEWLVTPWTAKSTGGIDEKPEQMEKKILSLVELSPESHHERVRVILGHLFPRIDWIFTGIGENTASRFMNANMRRSAAPNSGTSWVDLHACYPDYFDRYFQLSFPQSGLSRRSFHEIIELSLNDDKSGLDKKLRSLNQEGFFPEAMHKLRRFAEENTIYNPSNSNCTLLYILCDLSDEDFFFNDREIPDIAVTLAIHYTSAWSHPLSKARFVLQLVENTHGVYLPIRLVQQIQQGAENDDDSDATRTAFREVYEMAKPLCVEKIRKLDHEGKLLRHRQLVFLLQRWMEWGDKPDEVKNAIAQFTDSTEGLLTFLHGFVREERSWLFPEDPKNAIFDADSLAEFCDLSTIKDKIADLNQERLRNFDRNTIRLFEKSF